MSDKRKRWLEENWPRAQAIIEQRAEVDAAMAGESREFFWVNMNYRALVAELCADMSPEGVCKSCGNTFRDERDIQLEYYYPPRFQKDWERWHARNLYFACGECIRRRGDTPWTQWLDEEEARRVKRAGRPNSR